MWSSAQAKRMENKLQPKTVPALLVTGYYQKDESGKATMGRASKNG
jgi:hypothetical protein